MGAVSGKQIAQKHTIVIDNINLEETEPQEETVDPPVDPGKNMIQNGDFTEGDAHWINAVATPGEAEVNFTEGKAAYQIHNVGTEDWNVQLKHAEPLTLEQGASYQVRMRIKILSITIVCFCAICFPLTAPIEILRIVSASVSDFI